MHSGASHRVAPGALLAAVAPCGPSPREELEAGLAWLRGAHPVLSCFDPEARVGFLADTDARRARFLCDALAHPEVRALWCTRGGYGATRLLEVYGEELFAALKAHPKPLLGLSDVTALHALWARAGVPSWHAAMLASVGRGGVCEEDRDATLRALSGAPLAPWALTEPLRPGGAEGVARGGNLTVLAALVGTPWLPSMEGAVLFLEDVGERPYRLDRVLTSLRSAGFFRGVRAVVLGDFLQCDAGPDGVRAEDVLRERLGSLGVPLWAGAPLGHGPRQSPLPLGAPVTLESDGTLRFFTAGQAVT